MKRAVSVLLLAVMVLTFAACGGEPPRSEGLRVVVTIFPEYDWVREIVGDVPGVELTLLVANGTDIHSYQATAADMIAIADCDVFIHTGGVSDGWVQEALAASPGEERMVLNLMEALGEEALLEDTLLTGMEEVHDHGDHDHGDHDHGTWDEHIWLSLRNAETLCAHIAAVLAEADPENGDAYRANAAAYGENLAALDEAFADAVAEGARDVLLFADRYPFRYLAADYGLTVYAAFPGCSAESEASFETIAFLAGKVDELSLPVIFTIEGGDGAIARTVKDTAVGQAHIRTMDSMQAVSGGDMEAGANYLDIMEENLEVLKEALSGKE